MDCTHPLCSLDARWSALTTDVNYNSAKPVYLLMEKGRDVGSTIGLVIFSLEILLLHHEF